MLRGGPFPAGPAPLLPQVTLAALVLHVRYSASPPQSSGLRTSRRLWPAAPYAAARLWGQGPGPKAQSLSSAPPTATLAGTSQGRNPGQKPRAGTRRGVSWPPRKGAGRTVGRGRRGWRRTAAGPRARIRRGHLSRSVPARAAALRWAASGLHCCVPAPPAPRSSPREAVPCPLL